MDFSDSEHPAVGRLAGREGRGPASPCPAPTAGPCASETGPLCWVLGGQWGTKQRKPCSVLLPPRACKPSPDIGLLCVVNKLTVERVITVFTNKVVVNIECNSAHISTSLMLAIVMIILL